MEIRSTAVLSSPPPRDVLVLSHSEWNDYWKYATLYSATYFDGVGKRHDLGLSRQWSRIAKGGVVLTPYDFTYRAPDFMSTTGLVIDFKVVPDELPPSNIHVIIGRNGVGKSTLLRYMAQSLTEHRPSELG